MIDEVIKGRPAYFPVDVVHDGQRTEGVGELYVGGQVQHVLDNPSTPDLQAALEGWSEKHQAGTLTIEDQQGEPLQPTDVVREREDIVLIVVKVQDPNSSDLSS